MSAAFSMPDLSAACARLSLEWRLCDPITFGLDTASPLQRATCRIIDGRDLGDLADHPAVLRALGGVRWRSRVKPREVAIYSGIRTGKSLIASATAAHWTQTCDVSRLGPGEVPRVSIVSLTKDLADVVFSHVVGRIQQSPTLRSLVVGEPGTDCIHLRHPSGRPIQVKVVAGSRAGASLVARWSAGCIFDEFPRMVGGSDGVVNWDDMRDAVLLRLLPNAQILNIGSPWAPFGPAYDLVQGSWGKPTTSMVVLKAPAWDFNPWYWTDAEVERARSGGTKAVRSFVTDVESSFSQPEEALFSVSLLDRATRPQADPEPGQVYTAAMDPATRGNSWTFGVFTRRGTQKRMVHASQRTGSKSAPLSPRAVFADVIAPECLRYGIKAISTDQYYVDALQDIAREFGLSLVQEPLTETQKTQAYLGIRTKLEEGEIELPAEVREDLQRLKRRVTQAGVTIVLPVTSDGRHCDYAPTVMLGLGRYLRDTVPASKTEDPEVVRMRKAVEARFARPKEDY